MTGVSRLRLWPEKNRFERGNMYQTNISTTPTSSAPTPTTNVDPTTRPARDRHETGAVGELVRTELGDQVGRRAGRTGVVPQQCVADDPAVGVEHDHAVLLTADCPGSDVVEATGIREQPDGLSASRLTPLPQNPEQKPGQ